MFQSSPGLMAGRYHGGNPFRPQNPLFQSSPGLMAGRYDLVVGRRLGELNVSILARLNGRALLQDLLGLDGAFVVSILARLNGRALR